MKTKIHYLKLMAVIFILMIFVMMVDLQAQDYLISFTGTGASTTIDSVKIENLTQGTKLKMKGSDVLHLMGTTDIETITGDEPGKITFYPNPMKDYARMQFVLPVSGETLITLYEISGRIIAQTRDFLSTGKHTYGIQGIKEGMYFIRINAGKYSCAGRLMSSGTQATGIKIFYENTMALKEKQSDSKGVNEEKVMQYTTGDRLLLKGISGIYSTVLTNIPTSSKTITFNFIACTDGSNNNYPFVVIGTQTFMGENLKTTKYNDGTEIPLVTNNTTWSNLTTPGCCWYNNDATTYKAAYGALYNWYAVNSATNGNKNICPAGWHVPTDGEWTILENYLIANGYNYDGTTTGNKYAKALASTSGWASSSNAGAVGSTDYPARRNETGFTALPGGYRSYGGAFSNIGNNCYWWSASEFDGTNNAYCRYMSYDGSDVDSNYLYKKYGFSVRCVRD